MSGIWLARHGETDDNAPPQRVQGWIDVPLNERGREQARELAAAVSGLGIATLYTSQLARALETAEIVGGALGLEPVVDERLAESRRGEWEGRLLEEIQREQPEEWARWMRAGDDYVFPGGESLAGHCARVGEAIDEIAAGALPALVVCHGGTIRCAFARQNPRRLGAYHELDVPNGALLHLP